MYSLKLYHHDTEGGYYSSSFTTKLTVNGEPWNGEYCLPVSNSYSRGTSYYKVHRCVFLNKNYNTCDNIASQFIGSMMLKLVSILTTLPLQIFVLDIVKKKQKTNKLQLNTVQ
jgi:hypothetical protein